MIAEKWARGSLTPNTSLLAYLNFLGEAAQSLVNERKLFWQAPVPTLRSGSRRRGLGGSLADDGTCCWF